MQKFYIETESFCESRTRRAQVRKIKLQTIQHKNELKKGREKKRKKQEKARDIKEKPRKTIKSREKQWQTGKENQMAKSNEKKNIKKYKKQGHLKCIGYILQARK